MSFQHRLQKNRFELKYIIREETARSVRDFCRSYLVPDENAKEENGWQYPIHSVYLDGPGYMLAKSTVEGAKNRFKLRVRYYDDNPDAPVFFEIKRRVNDAILKQRAAIRRSKAIHLIDGGHYPEPSDLKNPTDMKAYDSLRVFCELRESINGTGKVIVSYLREAYVTPDSDQVRVTFDRNLITTKFEGRFVCGDFENGIRAPIGRTIHGCVLELKFTDRFPNWMRDLVHTFNLRRTSMPKYVNCLFTLGQDGMRDKIRSYEEMSAI
jgi:hypothetical protein